MRSAAERRDRREGAPLDARAGGGARYRDRARRALLQPARGFRRAAGGVRGCGARVPEHPDLPEFARDEPGGARFRRELARPYCGAAADVRSPNGSARRGAARSFAFMPLRTAQTFGLLALGERGPAALLSGMGTLYLKRLGELVSGGGAIPAAGYPKRRLSAMSETRRRDRRASDPAGRTPRIVAAFAAPPGRTRPRIPPCLRARRRRAARACAATPLSKLSCPICAASSRSCTPAASTGRSLARMLSAWRGFYRYLARDHGYSTQPVRRAARAQVAEDACRRRCRPTRRGD